MPEPQSERGQPVTTAGFTAPFETPIVPCGAGGLNLVDAVDKVAVGEWTRLTNLTSPPGDPQYMTGRAGQTLLASFGAGETVHSVTRMVDVAAGTSTRVWGVGTGVYLGLSGAPVLAVSGFSGDPLTLVASGVPATGDPWTFIGDRSLMRKVRVDGTVMPIGLPAPTVAIGTALGTAHSTAIQGAAPETWTGSQGRDYDQDGYPFNSTPPILTSFIGGVQMRIIPFWSGSAPPNAISWSFAGIAKTLNLNLVGGLPASDEDIIFLTLQFLTPKMLAEARIYVVCGATFSPTVLPGAGVDASGTPSTANTDYYVKSFRPGDFIQAAVPSTSNINAAETARVRAIREQALVRQSDEEGFASPRDGTVQRVDTAFLGTRDPSRSRGERAGTGVGESVTYGIVGIPLRRGDFQRFGNTTGRDWGTVTGLIISLQTIQLTDENGDPLVFVDSGTVFAMNLRSMTLHGGDGPDTMDPATQSYDYRYTHYDPRTGAESNPSPIQDGSNWIDSLRRRITLGPIAYGNAAIRQRFYRRGGTLLTDWHYVGVNASDGALFTDTLSDASIEAAGTVEIDHYQPVATVDDAGATVLAQPVPVIFGPMNGQLFGLGDPYRPGHLYASLPGEPDHWPPDLVCEVCPASEELMNGGLFGGQPYVVSRERLHAVYVNLGGTGAITSAPTECKVGLASRWGWAIGYGAMWIVSPTGIYRTSGGPEQCITDKIRPLFTLAAGESIHGYSPIDFTVETAIRLTCYNQELWFSYQDTLGARQTLVFQILTGRWRHYQFGAPLATAQADLIDPEAVLVLGGAATGAAYTHEGTSDAGAAIAAVARTGAIDFGRPREEKLFGDQIVDVDGQGVDLVLQNFLNAETVTNPTQALPLGSGRVRAIFDGFGDEPQRARSISTELSWSTTEPPPIVYFLGTSITVNPDLTINRVTNWDDLGRPDESYVIGITLDADTGGTDRTIVIERDWLGVISTIATLTVNHAGRHKKKYSWPAVQANQVRIRPDDECAAWILYRADWASFPEPPRISKWDVHFENGWDQYYTGLDLYCDTGGATKVIQVTVDGVVLTNPATSLPYWEITTTGRQVVHLTFEAGRGHVFHFAATDDNPGLLYAHKWHLDAEPSEQTNWNQNFSIWGTRADKWLKAIVFECDTFGQDKLVQVEVDGTTVETLTVNANGRRVVQLALSEQRLGRVWRIYPVDNHPGRLYTAQPIFDEEPFQLTRWETQEIDHDESGFHSLIEAQITLKSSAAVTLRISTYVNQTGTIVTDDYTIPSTSGVKLKRFVPFVARKGVLYKYLFFSDAPFWLYREESSVVIESWSTGQAKEVHPFGNDDLDRTRQMTVAAAAASRSGGGT